MHLFQKLFAGSLIVLVAASSAWTLNPDLPTLSAPGMDLASFWNAPHVSRHLHGGMVCTGPCRPNLSVTVLKKLYPVCATAVKRPLLIYRKPILVPAAPMCAMAN